MADDGGGIYTTGNVTITGGGVMFNKANRGFTDAFGGGIYIDGGVTTLNNAGIHANTVTSYEDTFGGGVYSRGVLILENNSYISDNEAGAGGGVYNRLAMYLRNSRVSGNKAGNAAGIDNYSYLEVTDSLITENIHSSSSGGHAGGIRNSGNMYILRGTISNNEGQFSGGIQNLSGSTASILQSTISGNEAGDGIFGVGGSGGGISNGGTMTITTSTISGNTANDNGGGISNGGTLTISNTTISGNTSQDTGGGIRNLSALTLVNSTITNNVTSGDGGGIHGGGGSVSLANTIITTNNAGTGNDCDTVLTATGPNLVSNTTGCIVIGTVPITGNAMLGLLAANGGSTQTHALLAGSPAIDAGDNTDCAADPVENKDQRGEVRPSGSQCDLGAFEVQQSPVVHELSINDVTLAEGNSGTTNFNFTVTLSPASDQEVRVARYSPNGAGNASWPGDYQLLLAVSIIFAPGQTTKTVTVVVNGDISLEPDETFEIELYNPTGAVITDKTGVGTILNDDVATVLPVMGIDDVSIVEGDRGIKQASFTLSLDQPSAFPVTVRPISADNTAMASNGDYSPFIFEFATFDPGETTAIFSVIINGDERVEPNETFFINLGDVNNATIGDSQGIGTIENDDFRFEVIQGSGFEQSELPRAGN